MCCSTSISIEYPLGCLAQDLCFDQCLSSVLYTSSHYEVEWLHHPVPAGHLHGGPEMETYRLRYVYLFILVARPGKYLLTHNGYCAENYNKDQLKGGVKEAVTLAGSALDVLNNNFGDEKVQKMVKHILGDDQNLQGRVDRAKGNCGRVPEPSGAYDHLNGVPS